MVVGQPTFTRQHPTASRTTIGSAAGVAVGGNRLFIADDNKIGAFPHNNRVLLYNNLSGLIIDPDVEPQQGTVCPLCVGVADVVLGQQNFEGTDPHLADGVQTPTGVASDGVRLVVADANNNRVLIWNSIPATNNASPDVVIGQADFKTNLPATTQTGMRGPQGVWIDSGRLFVADTQNGRVLIYNSIPTSNGARADIGLGQIDFNTRPEPDLTQSNVQPTTRSMLDPVSVTVNNGRLFVTDLGFNRVLIYLSVPRENNFPADVVVGQPDFTSADANNSEELCEALPDDGDDETEEPRYPARCDKTLNFPRFALSDGQRLYIADGGNDRVLIYNQIPTSNGAAPNYVLGQPDFDSLLESDGAASLRSPTSLAHDGKNLYVADPFSRRILVFTPAEDMIFQEGLRNAASIEVKSHAWVTFEGVSTTENPQGLPPVDFDIGVMVNEKEYFHKVKEGDTVEAVRDSVVNMINGDEDGVVTAVPIVGPGDYATGTVKFGGAIRGGDKLRLTIGAQIYDIEVAPNDTIEGLVDVFSFFVNGRPDPNVVAERDPGDAENNQLLLTFRDPGKSGNGLPFTMSGPADTPLTFEVSGESLAGGNSPYGFRLFAREQGLSGNDITIETTAPGQVLTDRSGARLAGGSDARELPAGTIATAFGANLAAQAIPAQLNGDKLPTEIDGVRVYANGVPAPLFYVGPEQINFQVPYEVAGTSVSVYVRRQTSQGVMVSVPRAADVTRAAPGLFTFPGPEPRRAIAVHAVGEAQGSVGITGADGATDEVVDAGVVATITVGGRTYTYTTVENDTPIIVRDRLVALINEGAGDTEVSASAGTEGFFSANATISLGGEIRVGDSVTVKIRDRSYVQTVVEGDTLTAVRNKLVERINSGNSGLGDPEVTARRSTDFGVVDLRIVARAIGSETNEIPFTLAVSDGARITATTEADEGFLTGGQTQPAVVLTARVAGRQGNDISYSAETSNPGELSVTARSITLCCGNDPFSLITNENPAVPGETIALLGTGLGLTAPLPAAQGLQSGQVTKAEPLFNVPAHADDFVSSLAGLDPRTASLVFSGLMPGGIGVYQINLRLNTGLPDNMETPIDIRQVLFFSNVVTIPVKGLRPRRDLE